MQENDQDNVSCNKSSEVYQKYDLELQFLGKQTCCFWMNIDAFWSSEQMCGIQIDRERFTEAYRQY